MAIQEDLSDDRRKYVRFTLKAYGLDHKCAVGDGSERADAQLIDITPAGARLRFAASDRKDVPPRQGRVVPVELRLPPVAPQGSKIPGEVRWTEGRECGVLFRPELDCSVGDLQRILDAKSPVRK